MANAMYQKARKRALEGGLGMAAGNVKRVLVRTGGGHYVVNLATDEFLSVIAGADQIAKSANFTSKVTTAGIFDAADLVFSAVAAGPAAGALVIYLDVDGTDANAQLIEYRDADTGLPVTPGGGDIDYIWDNGANKIFVI